MNVCNTCPHRSNIDRDVSGPVTIDGRPCKDGEIHPCHEDVKRDCMGHKIQVTLPESPSADMVKFYFTSVPRFPLEPVLEGLN